MIGTTISTRKRPARKNRRKGQQGSGFSAKAPHAVKRAAIGLGLVAVMAVLMVGLFFGYRWATTTENLSITEIVVTGNHHLSYGDVLSAARVGLGANSLDLNVTAVQARLAKNPWVAEVSVRRELPGKLIIDITEREAAYWTISGDHLYYCDSTGRLITGVTPGDSGSLPVLDAPTRLHGKLDQLPLAMEELEHVALVHAQTGLATVRVRESGMIECYMDKAGLTIKFSMDDHRAQLGRLMRVVDDLKQRGELADAAVITAGPDRIWVEKRTTTPEASG